MLWREAEGVAGPLFAEEITCVAHGFTQQIEMELSKKHLWRTHLSNDMNPLDIHRRATTFMRILLQ